jgi:hypothetical protein
VATLDNLAGLSRHRHGKHVMRIVALFAVLLLSSAAFAQTHQASFDDKSSQVRWTLAELNPELPADWSSDQFLTLEFRSSTPQRFELRVFTAGGVRAVRLQPFAGAWIRAALPLGYFERRDTQGFDLASLGNKSRAAYFINLTGHVGPLTGVEAIGLAMDHPLGSPKIEIRSLRLDKESPGDAVLEQKPLVDEFGQWISAPWPGKAQSLEELKAAWTDEEKSLEPGSFGYSSYGGYSNTHAKATGFFRVEQIGGRWWLVDPEGHLFFSTGADVMTPWMGTRTEGRDGVFAALPPADLRPPSFRPNQSSIVSFYTWNLLRRFGPDWPQAWIDLTLGRMDAWGFNTVANWSDPRLTAAKRKPYIVTLRGWGIDNTGYLGLPDVYAEEFAKKVDAAAAEQCAPHRDDPWLLGYFVANEPPWPGREAEIVAAILEGRDTAIQREAKKFLADGDTRARRQEFVENATVRCIDTINAAIKKHDPNHLNLGLRFGSRPSEAMLRASRDFDVFSMNSYAFEVNRAAVDAAYRVTQKPVLIGEFHFGTPGRGMAAGIIQVKDQVERGAAYRYYVENAAAHPAIIGTHWFEWIDEPNTGRNDGENYNIGFVDVTDRPYQELVDAAKGTHKRLLDIHSGKEQPTSRKALVR